MSTTAAAEQRPSRGPRGSATRAAVALVAAVLMLLAGWSVPPAGAQDGGGSGGDTTLEGGTSGDGNGGTGSTGADAGRATTSTAPVENREFGDIIPAPNSGREPETPGDPGGWMQVSLFFVLCAGILVIIGAVWWQSRRARARRAAAGLDPLDVARRRGEGVRPPR